MKRLHRLTAVARMVCMAPGTRRSLAGAGAGLRRIVGVNVTGGALIRPVGAKAAAPVPCTPPPPGPQAAVEAAEALRWATPVLDRVFPPHQCNEAAADRHTAAAIANLGSQVAS